jgi:hypothetical protein
MGDSARRHALAAFDWPVVISQYQALWEELSKRRDAAKARGLGAPRTHPLREDPFRLFEHYATRVLDQDSLLEAGPTAEPGRFQALASVRMNQAATYTLCDNEDMLTLLDMLRNTGPMRLGDLIRQLPNAKRAALTTTVGWLVKMDAIRIAGIHSTALADETEPHS